MKVLFTIMPAPAHLYPIVPIAWALQCAGHEVRVASHPGIADAVVATGLTAVPLGPEVDLAASVRAAADNPELERITRALALDPADHNLRTALRYYLMAPFANYYRSGAPGPEERPMVDALADFTRAWRPDLVLWDPLFFPAPVAARACGAAHARLLWGLDHFGWARTRFAERLGLPDTEPHEDLMAAMMRPTLERFGQDFAEELLVGQWTVDPTPQRLRLPADLRYVPVRWVPYNGAAAVPPWLRERPERPRVCLTLGVSGRKFFADDDVPVAGLLDAVAGLDIELVATLDRDQLAASRVEVPANVRTVDYLPLNLLLPTCSAIVHHGGAGTFVAAAAHRVPQLIVPKQGGDFVDHARYAEELGAGIAVEREGLTGAGLAKQMMRLVEEPAFRRGAEALYADMLAAPGPDGLVPVLEKLTEEHRGRG
ncbi:activator-dependent family glycosyltransferase [Streptomyces nanhaiensis]|uniref:activator-dependent family glycosyltransferase n=1 Tax=Streptomyces nanhaiensis TaxID=679319 RepID=UPI00399C4ECC